MASWLVVRVFYESLLANTSEAGKQTLIFQDNCKSHRQSKLELESSVFIFKFKYQRHLGRLAVYQGENMHANKHFPFSLPQITWQLRRYHVTSQTMGGYAVVWCVAVTQCGSAGKGKSYTSKENNPCSLLSSIR